MGEVKCLRCGVSVQEETARAGSDEYVCPLCQPPEGSLGKGLGRFWKSVIMVLSLIPAFFLQQCSFEQIAELRQLSRIPRTKIIAAVPGEVNLAGRARGREGEEGSGLARAFHTGKPCIYYYYTKERLEKDSDGNSKWKTVDSRSDFVPFLLDDTTGKLLVRPDQGVDFQVGQSFRKRNGDLRYTEYRIDPGDRVFIFGFLQEPTDGARHVQFKSSGDYHPLISENTELGERKKRGLGSVWLCWLGLCFLGVAAASLFSLLHLHRILIFFGLLSLVVGVVLFGLGVRMIEKDLISSQERVLRQEETVRNLIQDELKEHDVSWSGEWEQLGNISDFEGVPPRLKTRLRRVRIDLASASRRVREQVASFPYRFFRPFVGVDLPPEIPLPDRDEEFLRKIDAQFTTARVTPFGGIIGVVIGLAVGAGALFWGFRSIRVKRLMENLATTATSGVTYGLTEIKGIVDLPPPGESFFQGPLSQEPCLTYEYAIHERRGSGKNAKWVRTHFEAGRQVFRCLDRDGSILVDPDKAKVETWRKSVNRQGKLRYTETRLQLGDPVYVLGPARVDRDTGDSLLIRDASDEEKGTGLQPFIISGFQEDFLHRKGGTQGAALLTLSFAAVLFAALMLLGTVGAFNPAGYLAAALVGPFMMVLLTIVLHYNDLVYLRQLALRDRSNIDVALKKRNDLVPELEKVAREAMEHEREVLTGLAELRGAFLREERNDQVAEGHRAVESLWALREANPLLRSGGAMADLFDRLVACENEIAFISQGYNNAVETYNTRISVIPDRFLARIGRFEPMELLGETAVLRD